MYNAQALLDVHTRAHESLRRLIVFCGALTHEELTRPLHGFGFSTVHRQLEHTIGAEVYWQTVVTRGFTEEAALPDLPDIAAVEAGVSRKQIATLRANGIIERVLPDTSRIVAVARSSEQRLRAALAWGGPLAAAGGRSAAGRGRCWRR